VLRNGALRGAVRGWHAHAVYIRDRPRSFPAA
jgi:hypothetical protein